MARFVRLLVSLCFLIATFPVVLSAEEKTDRQNAGAPEFTIERMNALIDQANFIVDSKCSGTLISVTEKLILTNHHCTRDNISTVTEEVTEEDGSIKTVKRWKYTDMPVVQNTYSGFQLVASASYQTEIVAADEARDLALLRFRQKAIPMTMAAVMLPDGIDLVRGMRTVTVGNPAMLEASVVRGEISSLTRQLTVGGTKRDYIQISGGLYGGNSGGALFLAEGGYLIGVPAAGSPSATFLGFAIPIQSIKDFLKANCFARVWDLKAEKADKACQDKKDGKEPVKDTNVPVALNEEGGAVPAIYRHDPFASLRRVLGGY